MINSIHVMYTINGSITSHLDVASRLAKTCAQMYCKNLHVA